MPIQRLILKPGINVEASQLLNEGSWSSSSFVRFFQGYLQKIGGWTQLIATRILGTARSMLAWEDNVSNQYIAIGSEQGFEVYNNGTLYNVTPVETTDNVAVSFSTTNTSPTVKITDASNPATLGGLVTVANSISVGGLIIQGTYTVTNIVDANNYDIMAASDATATITNGGSAAEFTTTNTQSLVQVTLDNHGLLSGQVFTVYVSTTVATIVLFGSYTVQTVIDANNFTILAGSSANASTTGYENGGDVQLQYSLTPGSASSMNSGGLYGEGLYGQGVYGIGSSVTFVSARLWSFGYWGTDVIATYTNGSLYTWLSEDGLINNPSTLIATGPLNIAAGIFTAMPQQQAVALGASDGNSDAPDLMLVRFSNIGDNTAWTATATNQAGSFRLSRGSRIVGGLQGPQTGMIWTDVGLWLMQYIGFPLVYGFIEIGQGCGLIGQNAKGVLSGNVYWMSYNQFFVYNGNSVQILPCSVWDKVFKNLNTVQAAKIIACPNSFFNEISWCFPSATGSGENDTRVTYNATDNVWTYEPINAIVRTAWLDQSALLYPLGVDENGLIQQHEFGNDNNGTALTTYAQTGFIKIADGMEYTFLERLIPDAILLDCTLQITFFFQDYPDVSPTQIGPLNYTEASTYLIVRGRGRLVSVQIGSSDLGSFWRLGEMLLQGSPAGSR